MFLILYLNKMEKKKQFNFYISHSIEYIYSQEFLKEFRKFCLFDECDVIDQYKLLITRNDLIKNQHHNHAKEFDLIATVVTIKFPNVIPVLLEQNLITLNRHQGIPRVDFTRAIYWIEINIIKHDEQIKMIEQILDLFDLSRLTSDTITENFGKYRYCDDGGFHPQIQLGTINLLLNKYKFKKIELTIEKLLQSSPSIGGSRIIICGGDYSINDPPDEMGDILILESVLNSLRNANKKIYIFNWYTLWCTVWNGMNKNISDSACDLVLKYSDVFIMKETKFGNFKCVAEKIFNFKFPEEKIYYMSTSTLQSLLFPKNIKEENENETFEDILARCTWIDR